jgi:hypothetical protein
MQATEIMSTLRVPIAIRHSLKIIAAFEKKTMWKVLEELVEQKERELSAKAWAEFRAAEEERAHATQP